MKNGKTDMSSETEKCRNFFCLAIFVASHIVSNRVKNQNSKCQIFLYFKILNFFFHKKYETVLRVKWTGQKVIYKN